ADQFVEHALRAVHAEEHSGLAPARDPLVRFELDEVPVVTAVVRRRGPHGVRGRAGEFHRAVSYAAWVGFRHAARIAHRITDSTSPALLFTHGRPLNDVLEDRHIGSRSRWVVRP